MPGDSQTSGQDRKTDPEGPGESVTPRVDRFRLVVDEPRDGAWNMAADETLLEGVAGGGCATIRLYRWRSPTWSLGRLQRWEGSVDERFCRENGVGIVRRPTGGRALLHHRELTYAVVARPDGGVFAGSILETYRAIAGVIARAMDRVGARVGIETGPAARGEGALCFSVPSTFEIVSADGRRSKLAGSAQLRRRSAFLQHGSIPLALDDAMQRGAAGLPAGEPTETVTLSTVCGRVVTFEELARALREAFCEVPGIHLETGVWTRDELERIESLRALRYLDADWTIRGILRG